ncbi:MAG: hypothetical protein ACI4V7_05060 [Succinivibrionaceae bacterium]
MKAKMNALSFAMGAALIAMTGCGSSGSSGSSGSNEESKTLDIQAIDSYIENASVCIDLNEDSICNPEEDIKAADKTN